MLMVVANFHSCCFAQSLAKRSLLFGRATQYLPSRTFLEEYTLKVLKKLHVIIKGARVVWLANGNFTEQSSPTLLDLGKCSK